MEIYEFLFVCFIGFCSAFLNSSVAIGSGIFLVPSLAIMFPPKMALAIGTPIIVMADLLAILFYWKQWTSLKYILKLFLAMLPGLALGLILLPIISVSLFKLCLGTFGMLYAISMIFPNFVFTLTLKKVFKKIAEKYQNQEVYFFGLLAGTANIFAHAGGLVWSVFLQSRLHDKRVFLGTMVLLFFFSDILKTAAFLYIDLLSFETILYVLYSTPLFLLGSYLGNLVNKKLTGNTFRYIVLTIIFIASFNLCL